MSITMTCPQARIGLLCAALLGLALPAQKPAASVPPDPYTKGEAAALKKAGYVSFGPFPFGERHTSKQVEALLGDEPLIWVETAHFRLGCAVSPLGARRGDADWIKTLKAELKRLKLKMEGIKSAQRTLDPWLRTHLIAQRLEDIYAMIQRDLGVTDADFPQQPMDPTGPPDKYQGQGPYLGQISKYPVLILRRGASNARYTRAYGDRETTDPLRLFFQNHGTLGLCLSEETNQGLLRNDHALHAHLVYNVAINLLNGYRAYGHELPPWIVFGLAHRYSRQISPRYPAYDRKQDTRKEDSPFWQWGDRAAGLMKFGAFESLEDLMRREDVTAFDQEQHIQSWYLVDWLMTEHQPQLMSFLRRMKDPFHQRKKVPAQSEVTERQWQAWQDAFGCDLATTEAEWRKKAGTKKRRR